MSQLTPFLAAIAISLGLSTLILLAITRPLRQVLGMICESGDSTSFWVSFTAVMLYVFPLFFALFWTPIYHVDLVYAVRAASVSALFGAFVGLLVVGYKIASARRI